MATEDDAQSYRILIIGSGFSGIGMGVRLKQAGIHDFLVLERSTDVGGCWRDNTYPGCACDVESHLYSFSFEPNPVWSQKYSPSAEIHDYLKHCVRKYGLEEHIRFDQKVDSGSFDEATGQWGVCTTRGDKYRAQILVTAVGGLSNPAYPNIAGLDRFQGAMFHSAQWDHGFDLRGKRVAVIGTGASAIQFVPAIATEVEELKVFQRTPPWILPKADRRFSGWEKSIFRKLPFTSAAYRAFIYWKNEFLLLAFLKPDSGMRGLGESQCKTHLKNQVPDPSLRKALTPDYRLGCKRILISNDYYPALSRPNVKLFTSGIESVDERYVHTADGQSHEVDAIVLGTGFRVSKPLDSMKIEGLEGQELAALWENNGFQNYLGTMVSGFPNAFTIGGPNTGIGHTSFVFMAESQIRFVVKAIQMIEDKGAKYIDVKASAQERFHNEMQQKTEGTVWASGCNSWYLSESGKNFTIWPDFTFRYARRTRKLNPGDFELSAVNM